MLIYLNKALGSDADHQKFHGFHFIAACNGWLTTEDPAEAMIHLRWKDNQNKIEIYRSAEKICIDLPQFMLQKICNWLKCEDATSPEQEPPPIERPLANDMANEIQKQLIDFILKDQQLFIYLLHWPEGKPLAVALTHDVDLTRKFGTKKLLVDVMFGRWKEFGAHYRESAFSKNVYWNFEEILQLYRQLKLKATFFFIARPWEGFHYRYRIESKKFRHLFKAMSEQGHEIGLHSSRYAFDHPKRIMQEKRHLEKIIGQPVIGVRQHYLRLQFPQAWHYFQEAGFQYDSSCGYNESIGFRAATASIFSPFVPPPASISSLLEIPISLMDYPWSKHFFSDEQSKIIFENLWNSIEKFQGVMNILWHPSNIAEPAFRPMWQKMFEWLDKRNFYQGTLMDLQEWWRKKSDLKFLKREHNAEGIRFSIHTSSAMSGLCLDIISRKKLKCDASIQSVAMHQYRWKLPELAPGVTHFFLKYE